MKNRLSLLIALIISTSITTTCFASAETTTTPISTASTTTITLTLSDALNSLETSNTKIKLLDDNIKILGRQLDSDHGAAIRASYDDSKYHNQGSDKVQNKQQQLITAQQTELKYESAKHDRDQQLNNLKCTLERQYMNVLIYEAQIANIKNSIANVDEQIAQTEAKIKQGQVTADSIQPLQVKKSQLISQINMPQAQLQQNLLNIKQELNIDLNVSIKLVSIKKDFIKYNDSNIEQTIKNSINKNYSIYQQGKTLELDKVNADIYNKYSLNQEAAVANSQLQVNADQITLDNLKITTEVSLWSAYYNLKGKEDTITTDRLIVENDQMVYDNAAAQFVNGQIDKVTLDKLAFQLESDKITLQNDINDYMVTVEEFNNQLTK